MAVFRKGFFLILGVVVLLAIHCDEFEPVEGQYECSSHSDCPPDWQCNVQGDGLCYSDASKFPDGDGGS
jgi:hypothetical protein